ncbi:MAG: hypothetical protein ACFFG0_26815 [Candidatus Thorarchaeota archaeon]
MIPTLPSDTFDASDTFDIEVYFNDTGLIQGIEGATIEYKIENGSVRTDKISIIGNGYYNITIDCNDTDFSGYGLKSIEINASKDFYNNQSKQVDITILGETALVPSIPKLSYNSTENFDIALFFNDTVKDLGVDGATISVYVNETLYNDAVITPYGGGDYNITVDCDDNIFDDDSYGYFNLSVVVEKSFYYNQSTWFIIYITGETSVSANKYPDPVVGYYNSDETFNITAYFEDIGRNEGIPGGTARIYVKESTLSSYQEYLISAFEFGVGYYNFTIDCSDAIFFPYGKYDIKINITKPNYYSEEVILQEIVIGNTTLTILDPTGTVSYVEDETFDIVIEYEDHTRSSGINGADITYTIDGTNYRSDNILPNGDGIYNITIDAGDADFGINYKNVDIIIRANLTNYINLTRTFTFERQITTIIDPLTSKDLGSVMRGLNVSYTFNYTDFPSYNPIIGANWARVSPDNGFDVFLKDWANGTYTINLNTTYVDVSGSPYTYIFTISAVGNETQTINLTIDVTIIQTKIVNPTWDSLIARNSRLNQTVRFYFNDTTNNKAILGLVTNNIRVTNYATGAEWNRGDFNYKLIDLWNNGTYILDISTRGLDSGSYTLVLNVSKFPNYDVSLANITFYLRGNYTKFNLMSISDSGGALTSIDSGYHYRIFKGDDINLEYSLLDLEYNNNTVLVPASSYLVMYKNLNTGGTGILQTTVQYDYPNHEGDIITSNSELVAGNYLINITTAVLNYENVTFYFNVTIIEKNNVRITIIDQPTEVTAGGRFNITVKAEYLNGSVWTPLLGVGMTITTYFDDTEGNQFNPIYTNSSGIYVFRITTIEATNITLIVEIPEEYNHLGDTLEILNIKLNPIPSGLSFEDLMPYLIIIGAVVGAGGGSFAVYRGVIVPKKREKARILTEVKTIFDDAINLEHILVLYKGTGTCIYFKSFGTEGIDPELISGFISAICSFGKDLVCQEELNEITYGDRMLLLSDGEYIRVALVLSKKASIILRKNLMEFINEFEKSYANELPNWRGQLNIFRDSGAMIDEILSTSIILPHEITYKFSNVKALKNPHSKEVLKVANNLMKDSERNFFFIATLLKEAAEKTNKDTAEIFMGIKELKDKKILMPIEIGVIEAQPISQQELNLINQRVAGLVILSQEEKQKLVNDLAQMGPAEREAYFASLTEQHEIISAPIEEKPGAALIDNVKSAKKEIGKLKKIAKTARKEKDYEKTINIYQNAVKIALSWELSGEIELLNDFIRTTKIEDLQIKMKNLEQEAKLAAKDEKYNEAAQKYKMSSKIASEIFKLGGSDMTKEVKRLSNKSKEYEKLI